MLDVFTSMFLHAGWLHLLGNMLFLWIFGANVEDRLGRARFLLVFLVGGVVADAAQVLSDPASEVPMIGASGAIAAVLGAYLVLFPRARIQSLVFLGFFYQLIAVPAVIVLGFWFLLQVADGIGSLGPTTVVDGGVAFFAHIGGFVAGALLALPFRLPRPTRGIIRPWPRIPSTTSPWSSRASACTCRRAVTSCCSRRSGSGGSCRSGSGRGRPAPSRRTSRAWSRSVR